MTVVLSKIAGEVTLFATNLHLVEFRYDPGRIYVP
jgi:hypothetical protein